MAKETGFFQLRRGIWEHVRDGRMSTTEALAFIYIATQADTRNGIWKGSAKSLSGELGIPERTARDVLEKMEHGDYIRRFATPGKHSCYPILVHKFPITQGEHNGEHLNALASVSPEDLTYFSREQSVELNGEHGAAQRRSKNKEVKNTAPQIGASPCQDESQNLRGKKAHKADERFQPVVDVYYQEQRATGVEPGCDDSDFGALRAWLKRNRARAVESIAVSLRNAITSTDHFPLRPGFRLREFLEHESKYQLGPLLRIAPKIVPKPAALPKNELSPNGAAKIKAYMEGAS